MLNKEEKAFLAEEQKKIDSTPDNPPAFPTRAINAHEQYLEGGMTLRDYFAAAALTGVLALGEIWTTPKPKGFGPDVAEMVYEIADDMLKARSE